MKVVKGNEIDNLIAEYREGLRDAVRGLHRMGRALLKIYRSGAYKHKHKVGQPGQFYRGFNEFVEAVFSISGAYARQLMGISETFSPCDVATYGVTKLNILLRFDEATRDQLKPRLLEMSRIQLEALAKGKAKVTGNAAASTARNSRRLHVRKSHLVGSTPELGSELFEFLGKLSLVISPPADEELHDEWLATAARLLMLTNLGAVKKTG